MKQILILIFLLAALPAGSFGQQRPAASEILDRIDRNMVYDTARAEMEMIITVGGREIRKSFISFSRGNEKSYIEFLSPPRDMSTKILKIEDVVRVYYPSAERVMRLSGHMLNQSMMGSDFSFEDMTERSRKLREEYTAEVKGEETAAGRPCYVLVMTSKIEKQTYFTRKSWIDRERFIGLKEELYARSGKLLKTMEVEGVQTIGRRSYPTRILLQDKLRENSKTELVITKIQFDLVIADEMFTERQLLKK